MTDRERMLTMGLVGLGIAHELNAPLTTAQLGLELLAMRLRGPTPPTPAESAQAVEEVLATIHRAGALVQRMRAYALGSKSGEAWIRLEDVVDAIAKIARSAAADRSLIEVCRRSQRVEVEVFADQLLLEQAAAVLVLNAIDALGERGTIEVGVVWCDGAPTLVVRDDGPGFSDLSPVSLGASTKAHGMGVGLSLATRIVGDSGGRLERSSRPEGGAEVQLRFERWRTP